MLQTVDYIIVSSSDDDHLSGFHQFAEKVNRKLRAGFQLHGPPVGAGHYLCQALTKPITVDENQPVAAPIRRNSPASGLGQRGSSQP
jgi:hypothetical protein